MLTIGSLFSGIGGLELGLERGAGARTLWQVENNPFCHRVLERHWPHARRHEDVRDVGAHNLDPVDVICGGFPCQDISVAGNGEGLDGARSGLWGSDFIRIVREVRPRFVVVENSAALLARGLGRVLGDLAACGYDAEWDCVPAQAVGAPHRRDRLFILAWRSTADSVGDVVRIESGGGSGTGGPARASVSRDARSSRDALPDANSRRREGERRAHVEPQLPPGAVADGRDCSRADVPNVDREVGRLTTRPAVDGDCGEAVRAGAAQPRRRDRPLPDSDRAQREGVRVTGGVQPPHADADSDRGWPRPIRRDWGLPPPSIRRMDAGVPAGLDGPRRRRRPANDRHRLHALGNAVVVDVATYIGERLADLVARKAA